MHRTAALSMLLIVFLVAVSSAKPRPTRTILRIYADKNSDVHIVLSNGKQALVRHQQDQTGIEDVKIAADGRTAGWLVLYLVPDETSADFEGSLVIWRDGKVVRTFDSGPVFWSWSFLHGADQVAYRIGSLHGQPSSHCELRDVNTGRLLESWDGDLEKPDRPQWTKTLDH